MKKIIYTFLFTFFILLICTYSINASDSSVNLSTDNKHISIGDEFIATITICNDKAFSGIQFSLNFDNEAFEFEKLELEDSENYALYGATPESIEILSLEGNITPLVANITFKVKDTTSNGNYTISASNMKIGFIEDDAIESLDPINLSIHIGETNIFVWCLLVIAIMVIIIFIILKKKKEKAR